MDFLFQTTNTCIKYSGLLCTTPVSFVFMDAKGEFKRYYSSDKEGCTLVYKPYFSTRDGDQQVREPNCDIF